MELDEKEAHCVARLLQTFLWQNRHNMYGCSFCKFECPRKGVEKTRLLEIQQKFQDETGVDLVSIGWGHIPFSDFPYKKFLVNSNEKIQELFKNAFSEIPDKPKSMLPKDKNDPIVKMVEEIRESPVENITRRYFTVKGD